MAQLRRLVDAVRRVARHVSDTRRFRDWHVARQRRRGR
jgi:hypothetical protein